jgi:hypothetical protein
VGQPEFYRFLATDARFKIEAEGRHCSVLDELLDY